MDADLDTGRKSYYPTYKCQQFFGYWEITGWVLGLDSRENTQHDHIEMVVLEDVEQLVSVVLGERSHIQDTLQHHHYNVNVGVLLFQFLNESLDCGLSTVFVNHVCVLFEASILELS